MSKKIMFMSILAYMFLFSIVNFHSVDAIQTKTGQIISITQFDIDDFFSDLKKGCFAKINTDQDFEDIVVISEDAGICNILGDAFLTGNNFTFKGDPFSSPPEPPGGGQWGNPVFTIESILLKQ